MIVLIVAAAIAIAPSPAPTSTATYVVWQGVMLGEGTAAVSKRLGAPTTRRRTVGGSFLLEYPALAGSGILALTDSDGVIAGIRLTVENSSSLRAPVVDPFGVSLGDSEDRLSEVRGAPARYDDEGGGEFTSYYGKASDVRWAYGLRDGVVRSIGVIMPYRIVRATGAVATVATPRPANAPTPLPPDGSSPDRAIRVTLDDIDRDPEFEFSFVNKISCATGDHWTAVGDMVFNAKRRNFSRVNAVCKSTNEQRDFYFDITAVFGKAFR